MGPPNAAAARTPLTPALALAAAAAAALVLALDVLDLVRAPGCGRDGACASAARSAFGHVPGLDWPTAFAGLAWFTALLAAWLAARGRWTRGFRGFACAGALPSLVLTGALLALGHLCPWCLAAHAANFVFAWRVFRAPAPRAAERAPWLVFAVVFAAASGALAFARVTARERAHDLAERELARSTAELRAAPEDAHARFTGRWRTGAEAARARVVVFTDYQCPDCQRVERELDAYLAAHADTSLSVKHFPMCPECNRHAPNLHPNACWAARAAEVAGALGGNDGFWRMHRWLFARAGSFTKAELEAALPALGFDAQSFQRALNAPESLAGITADVEEAMALGLARTPLVYVNGVELRGWDAPGAIARGLDAAQSAPGAVDRPAGAREKILGDWRAEPVHTFAPALFPRWLGPRDAPVTITLFGDYQDEFTVAADRELRALALARDDVRYTYRHFPANTACNPGLPRTLHPLSCLAALGAELAGALQGESGYWVMHDWLMEHREGFDDARLLAEAQALGIEETTFWEVLKSAELGAAITDDVAAATELGVDTIPAIWIDGKRLMRWQSGSESLFPVVIDEARRR